MNRIRDTSKQPTLFFVLNDCLLFQNTEQFRSTYMAKYTNVNPETVSLIQGYNNGYKSFVNTECEFSFQCNLPYKYNVEKT